MLKLTRLDHQVIAINPDHLAWVEATPDTTLCLLGDRKIIVRESVEEVMSRFNEARAAVGCTAMGVANMAGPSSEGRRSSLLPHRHSNRPSVPAPQVVDPFNAFTNSQTGTTLRFGERPVLPRRDQESK